MQFMGGQCTLDQDSEDKIKELAQKSVMDNHKGEYESNLLRFRKIVYHQEVVSMKLYLETRHPEQVDLIVRLRGILNHERSG